MQIFELDTSPIQGTFLIEASAGTGKTYSLTRIVLRLLMETNIRIDQVLMVTYTNAAAGELKARLRDLLIEVKEAIESTSSTSEVHFDDKTLNTLYSRWDHNTVAERVSAALDGLDDACISTIHSFCQKMLKEHLFSGEQSNDFDPKENVDDLVDRVIDDFLREELQKADEQLREEILRPGQPKEILRELLTQYVKLPLHSSYRFYTKWREDMPANGCASAEKDSKKNSNNSKEKTPCDSEQLMEFLDRFLTIAPKRLRQLKISNQTNTFDDMIGDVEKELSNPAFTDPISKQFRAVLIDEFQDTDPVQYNIFKTLFLDKTRQDPSRCLIFVGDPKQSIYRFRGADIDTYEKARSDVDKTLNLAKNYRSNAALLEIINHFFADHDGAYAFGTNAIRYLPVQAGSDKLPLYREDESGQKKILPVFEYWYRDDDHRLASEENQLNEAQLIANDIYTLLNSGVMTKPDQPLMAKDIVILVRSHKHADLVIEALAQKRIRTLSHRRDDVLQTEEAEDVLNILKAMEVPQDNKRLKLARLTRIMGDSVNDVSPEAFNLPRSQTPAEKKALKARECIDEARNLFNRKGVASAFAWLFEQYQTQEKLLPLNGGEKRLNHFNHIIELLQEQSRHLNSISGLTRWLSKTMRRFSDEEKRQTRLENDENLVTVMTIHGSKGLEFPVVYLANAWRNSAIDYSSKHVCSALNAHGSGKTLTISYSEQNVKNASPEQTEADLLENIRLAYVAMTRASQRLVMPLLLRKKANKTDFRAPYFRALTKQQQPSNESIKLAQEKLFHDLEVYLDANKAIIEKIKFGLGVSDLKSTDLFSMICVSPEENKLPLHKDFVPKTEEDKPILSTQPCHSLHATWHQSSYTAIMRGITEHADQERQAEKEDQVQEQALAENEQDTKIENNASILTFSRGPESGTFLHALFEHIDFELVAKANAGDQQSQQKLLKRTEVLSRPYAHNFSDLNAEMLAELMRNVLCARIQTKEDSFQLCQIDPRYKQREMTFTMSIKEPLKNRRSVSAYTLALLLKAFDKKYHLPEMEAKNLKGFLNGAIDMVFMQNHRFYILDWKSNFLGDTASQYGQTAMKKAMQSHHYYLQYLIYCVALKRYLQLRHIELTQDNFGGVIYAFIRGIRAEQKNSNGIFFEQPPLALIECLDDFFLHGFDPKTIGRFAQKTTLRE